MAKVQLILKRHQGSEVTRSEGQEEKSTGATTAVRSTCPGKRQAKAGERPVPGPRNPGRQDTPGAPRHGPWVGKGHQGYTCQVL